MHGKLAINAVIITYRYRREVNPIISRIVNAAALFLSGTKCLQNLSTLWRLEWTFRCVIFKLNLMIAGWGISCEITDDKSILAQLMA